ncbi:hypothetical protein [Pseudaminobacter soli (ex Li et al. 2025)]|uniref:Uncharacterized protein n=1 Tax=Pseudaminobacter soli (ex Li et al. 2025) TaxID=1295366 RepID=A0A2P7SEA7_9HYPH|nr:hypothetical protein [Mesorhizobium soli]PSJ60803.1 hypothetical protein C7I85_12235 [Mesorhizobium soli]
MDNRFWLELREPNRVPQRKGPFLKSRTAEVLREFMDARPTAFISVVTVDHDGPLFEDAPECLMIADGRSKARALRHIQSSKAAHASALISKEQPK